MPWDFEIVPNGTAEYQQNASWLQRLDLIEGIDFWQGALIFLIAALLCFSRWSSLILHPQFYGEDGTYWYAQAYEGGWLHSMTIPVQGYLNNLQRFGAGFSLLVPFHLAPLVMALFGLAMQCVPVLVVLSKRCRVWGPLSLRALWAILYIGMPNTREIHVVLTNSQWHLLLATLLLSFAEPPRSWIGRTVDIFCFVLVGLSGPFCLLLVPLLAIYWWKRRYSWTLVQTAMTAACAGTQAWFLLRYFNRPSTALGVNFERTMRLFSGNVIGGTLLGGNHEMGIKPLPLLVMAAVFGVVIFVYVLRYANLELKLLVTFCLLLLAASLKSPVISGHYRWETLITTAYCRYWFYPMLAFIWSVAWCWRRARNGLLRKASAAWLCLTIVGVVTGWELIPYPDFNSTLR